MLQLILSPAGLTVLGLVGYLVSCGAHPYRVCTACGGSKESHSTTFKGAYGVCRPCGGQGRTVRFGAKLLGKS